MGAGRGGLQQCQFVPDQTVPEELKLEAAANTPGLTQLGREKGRKASPLSDQGRIRPTPGEMNCLERSFLLHTSISRITGYLRESFGKSSCMLKIPKFCNKDLAVPNPLFLNTKQNKKKLKSYANYRYGSETKQPRLKSLKASLALVILLAMAIPE